MRDLASRFPSPVLNYSQVPSCGEAYRRALSTAPDGSVAIAAIGFMVCLRDLLMSGADEFSSFNGRELVAKKVTKVVFQGGWYAPLHPNGHDTFNWNCGRGWGFNPSDDGCNGAAQYVLANMPPTVQMIFSDIGDEVLYGGKLTTCGTHQPMSASVCGLSRTRRQSTIMGPGRRNASSARPGKVVRLSNRRRLP